MISAREVAQATILMGAVAGGIYGGYKGLSLYHKKTPPEAREWYLYALSGLGGVSVGQVVGIMAGMTTGLALLLSRTPYVRLHF